MDFRSQMEAEEREPNFVFHMDCTAHYKQEETDCCKGFSELCTCGGVGHYQPVYGGYYYKCEACLKEWA